ncbi:hypothetical protein HK102_007157 [Quaeritorhiza haematococci]|nr:hypothetical protein HK102_007157 [Quaeritorhiza haematococci]
MAESLSSPWLERFCDERLTAAISQATAVNSRASNNPQLQPDAFVHASPSKDRPSSPSPPLSLSKKPIHSNTTNISASNAGNVEADEGTIAEQAKVDESAELRIDEEATSANMSGADKSGSGLTGEQGVEVLNGDLKRKTNPAKRVQLGKALEQYEKDNPNRAITTIRRGIVMLKKYHLELRYHMDEYGGSEDCGVFGEPKHIGDNVLIRRNLKTLSDISDISGREREPSVGAREGQVGDVVEVDARQQVADGGGAGRNDVDEEPGEVETAYIVGQHPAWHKFDLTELTDEDRLPVSLSGARSRRLGTGTGVSSSDLMDLDPDFLPASFMAMPSSPVTIPYNPQFMSPPDFDLRRSSSTGTLFPRGSPSPRILQHPERRTPHMEGNASRLSHPFLTSVFPVPQQVSPYGDESQFQGKYDWRFHGGMMTSPGGADFGEGSSSGFYVDGRSGSMGLRKGASWHGRERVGPPSYPFLVRGMPPGAVSGGSPSGSMFGDPGNGMIIEEGPLLHPEMMAYQQLQPQQVIFNTSIGQQRQGISSQQQQNRGPRSEPRQQSQSQHYQRDPQPRSNSVGRDRFQNLPQYPWNSHEMSGSGPSTPSPYSHGGGAAGGSRWKGKGVARMSDGGDTSKKSRFAGTSPSAYATKMRTPLGSGSGSKDVTSGFINRNKREGKESLGRGNNDQDACDDEMNAVFGSITSSALREVDLDGFASSGVGSSGVGGGRRVGSPMGGSAGGRSHITRQEGLEIGSNKARQDTAATSVRNGEASSGGKTISSPKEGHPKMIDDGIEDDEDDYFETVDDAFDYEIIEDECGEGGGMGDENADADFEMMIGGEREDGNEGENDEGKGEMTCEEEEYDDEFEDGEIKDDDVREEPRPVSAVADSAADADVDASRKGKGKQRASEIDESSRDKDGDDRRNQREPDNGCNKEDRDKGERPLILPTLGSGSPLKAFRKSVEPSGRKVGTPRNRITARLDLSSRTPPSSSLVPTCADRNNALANKRKEGCDGGMPDENGGSTLAEGGGEEQETMFPKTQMETSNDIRMSPMSQTHEEDGEVASQFRQMQTQSPWSFESQSVEPLLRPPVTSRSKSTDVEEGDGAQSQEDMDVLASSPGYMTQVPRRLGSNVRNDATHGGEGDGSDSGVNSQHENKNSALSMESVHAGEARGVDGADLLNEFQSQVVRSEDVEMDDVARDGSAHQAKREGDDSDREDGNSDGSLSPYIPFRVDVQEAWSREDAMNSDSSITRLDENDGLQVPGSQSKQISSLLHSSILSTFGDDNLVNDDLSNVPTEEGSSQLSQNIDRKIHDDDDDGDKPVEMDVESVDPTRRPELSMVDKAAEAQAAGTAESNDGQASPDHEADGKSTPGKRHRRQNRLAWSDEEEDVDRDFALGQGEPQQNSAFEFWAPGSQPLEINIPLDCTPSLASHADHDVGKQDERTEQQLHPTQDDDLFGDQMEMAKSEEQDKAMERRDVAVKIVDSSRSKSIVNDKAEEHNSKIHAKETGCHAEQPGQVFRRDEASTRTPVRRQRSHQRRASMPPLSSTPLPVSTPAAPTAKCDLSIKTTARPSPARWLLNIGSAAYKFAKHVAGWEDTADSSSTSPTPTPPAGSQPTERTPEAPSVVSSEARPSPSLQQSPTLDDRQGASSSQPLDDPCVTSIVSTTTETPTARTMKSRATTSGDTLTTGDEVSKDQDGNCNVEAMAVDDIDGAEGTELMALAGDHDQHEVMNQDDDTSMPQRGVTRDTVESSNATVELEQLSLPHDAPEEQQPENSRRDLLTVTLTELPSVEDQLRPDTATQSGEGRILAADTDEHVMEVAVEVAAHDLETENQSNRFESVAASEKLSLLRVDDGSHGRNVDKDITSAVTETSLDMPADSCKDGQGNSDNTIATIDTIDRIEHESAVEGGMDVDQVENVKQPATDLDDSHTTLGSQYAPSEGRVTILARESNPSSQDRPRPDGKSQQNVEGSQNPSRQNESETRSAEEVPQTESENTHTHNLSFSRSASSSMSSSFLFNGSAESVDFYQELLPHERDRLRMLESARVGEGEDRSNLGRKAEGDIIDNETQEAMEVDKDLEAGENAVTDQRKEDEAEDTAIGVSEQKGIKHNPEIPESDERTSQITTISCSSGTAGHQQTEDDDEHEYRTTLEGHHLDLEGDVDQPIEDTSIAEDVAERNGEDTSLESRRASILPEIATIASPVRDSRSSSQTAGSTTITWSPETPPRAIMPERMDSTSAPSAEQGRGAGSRSDRPSETANLSEMSKVSTSEADVQNHGIDSSNASDPDADVISAGGDASNEGQAGQSDEEHEQNEREEPQQDRSVQRHPEHDSGNDADISSISDTLKTRAPSSQVSKQQSAAPGGSTQMESSQHHITFTQALDDAIEEEETFNSTGQDDSLGYGSLAIIDFAAAVGAEATEEGTRPVEPAKVERMADEGRSPQREDINDESLDRESALASSEVIDRGSKRSRSCSPEEVVDAKRRKLADEEPVKDDAQINGDHSSVILSQNLDSRESKVSSPKNDYVHEEGDSKNSDQERQIESGTQQRDVVMDDDNTRRGLLLVVVSKPSAVDRDTLSPFSSSHFQGDLPFSATLPPNPPDHSHVTKLDTNDFEQEDLPEGFEFSGESLELSSPQIPSSEMDLFTPLPATNPDDGVAQSSSKEINDENMDAKYDGVRWLHDEEFAKEDDPIMSSLPNFSGLPNSGSSEDVQVRSEIQAITGSGRETTSITLGGGTALEGEKSLTDEDDIEDDDEHHESSMDTEDAGNSHATQRSSSPIFDSPPARIIRRKTWDPSYGVSARDKKAGQRESSAGVSGSTASVTKPGAFGRKSHLQFFPNTSVDDAGDDDEGSDWDTDTCAEVDRVCQAVEMEHLDSMQRDSQRSDSDRVNVDFAAENDTDRETTSAPKGRSASDDAMLTAGKSSRIMDASGARKRGHMEGEQELAPHEEDEGDYCRSQEDLFSNSQVEIEEESEPAAVCEGTGQTSEFVAHELKRKVDDSIPEKEGSANARKEEEKLEVEGGQGPLKSAMSQEPDVEEPTPSDATAPFPTVSKETSPSQLTAMVMSPAKPKGHKAIVSIRSSPALKKQITAMATKGNESAGSEREDVSSPSINKNRRSLRLMTKSATQTSASSSSKGSLLSSEHSDSSDRELESSSRITGRNLFGELLKAKSTDLNGSSGARVRDIGGSQGDRRHPRKSKSALPRMPKSSRSRSVSSKRTALEHRQSDISSPEMSPRKPIRHFSMKQRSAPSSSRKARESRASSQTDARLSREDLERFGLDEGVREEVSVVSSHKVLKMMIFDMMESNEEDAPEDVDDSHESRVREDEAVAPIEEDSGGLEEPSVDNNVLPESAEMSVENVNDLKASALSNAEQPGGNVGPLKSIKTEKVVRKEEIVRMKVSVGDDDVEMVKVDVSNKSIVTINKSDIGVGVGSKKRKQLASTGGDSKELPDAKKPRLADRKQELQGDGVTKKSGIPIARRTKIPERCRSPLDKNSGLSRSVSMSSTKSDAKAELSSKGKETASSSKQAPTVAPTKKESLSRRTSSSTSSSSVSSISSIFIGKTAASTKSKIAKTGLGATKRSKQIPAPIRKQGGTSQLPAPTSSRLPKSTAEQDREFKDFVLATVGDGSVPAWKRPFFRNLDVDVRPNQNGLGQDGRQTKPNNGGNANPNPASLARGPPPKRPLRKELTGYFAQFAVDGSGVDVLKWS